MQHLITTKALLTTNIVTSYYENEEDGAKTAVGKAGGALEIC